MQHAKCTVSRMSLVEIEYMVRDSIYEFMYQGH